MLYKATRPDGTDFRTGTVNYAAALASGETLTHPAPKRRPGNASTYLSVATTPTDCTGMRWPCRLFTVEPVGRAYRNGELKHKRETRALRVTAELPAWQVFSPHGEAVVSLIDRAGRITPDEASRLDATWAAAWDATWAAAWDAARDAAWDAARAAARAAAWAATWDAARAAALALVVQDLITAAQFNTLYGPWKQVMEP